MSETYTLRIYMFDHLNASGRRSNLKCYWSAHRSLFEHKVEKYAAQRYLESLKRKKEINHYWTIEGQD